MKKCSKCRTNKPLNQFHKNARSVDGVNAYCKVCSSAYSKTRYTKKLPSIVKTAKTKECRICHHVLPMTDFTKRKGGNAETYCRSCMKAYNRKRVVERHGITLERYAQISADQNGQCAICSAEAMLVIDHDHRHCSGPYGCGLCFRGLICSKCNRILGQLDDNPKTLLAMVSYLELNAK